MGKRPNHIGVIMDGNRRWAKSHALRSVLEGHSRGVDTFIELCHLCAEFEIPYLTVYAFSTENWRREKEEVDGLFNLMKKFFTDEVDTCVESGYKMNVVGDLSMLSEDSRQTVMATMEKTKDCKKLHCNIAISYGGRDEIIRAAKAYGRDLLDGKASLDIDEDGFASYLDTAGMPDIDLVIRTGGDKRLSNFFPWQTVYSDFFFTDVLWPDFGREEFVKAIDYYGDVRINKGK